MVTPANRDIPVEEQLILGEKLDDPYTIENMRAAFMSLLSKDNAGLHKRAAIEDSEFEIDPNYIYVKFLPYGEEQWAIMEGYETSDSNFVLFDYPMDYEIIQEGIDPSLPDSVRAYYAAVPADFQFPEEGDL
ncbi:hypothetical protein CHISP_2343 [Chitinispirillum alkaliphilum]|nr:hypothetical protein CHISP_2343 [Chitinispirillum alkaliphilum]